MFGERLKNGKGITKNNKVFFGNNIYVKLVPLRNYVVFACMALVFTGLLSSFRPNHKSSTSLVNGLPQIEFVKKIWEDAPHNAFTDLTFFKGHWYCVFREAASHHSKDGNGVIRIIRSTDTETWESVHIIQDEKFDLRDPKLAITPKGRLMVNFFGVPMPDSATIASGSLLSKQFESRMVTSNNGEKWGNHHKLNLTNELAWRVTWHKGIAYTITYQPNGGVTLYKSTNGVDFKLVSKLPLKGFPNEASIAFMPDDKMVAMIREEEKPNRTYVGECLPPYTDWKFTETPKFSGGPNILKLPDNNLLATFRQYENGVGKLWLGKLDNQKVTEIIDIKSFGDCGYAGMHWKDDALWMSYYSTHEQKTSIYLAKIKFNPLKN